MYGCIGKLDCMERRKYGFFCMIAWRVENMDFFA